MNKVILSCAIWLLTSAFASAQSPTIADLKPDTIKVTTGYSMKFHSAILNEDRMIMVSVPEGYATSNKKYPVVYILDAQWNFNHASQNLAWLSSQIIKLFHNQLSLV
ncbi:alpha/beta hydrolase-fold protein [Segatella paludivivens]|uniref:alpha/beta hydrolase-fold protein n=1 Tax=Segatella paludivivens TaxID=185294 RepID=UPI00138DFFEB|nr:alpha/beta hydrolase-fold protein [Segatella paludivivens]